MIIFIGFVFQVILPCVLRHHNTINYFYLAEPVMTIII